jgi:glycosyltransferase involved in cell wall biosynthesis
MPIVGIVIPHFNQLEYLGECVESVRNQTFTDWEAIVVDDASTNCDAEQFVRQINDPRLLFIRHASNRGQGAARNTGIKSSKAELILPLDADDRLHPEFLETTTNVLREKPQVDCVFTEFQLFGSSNDIWHFNVRSPKDMLVQQWIPGAGTLLRRHLWAAIGGYSEVRELSGNEDWEFWIKAIRHDVEAAAIPQALYFYRRHPESTTVTSLPYRDYRTREIIYQSHKEFFDQHNAGVQFMAEGYLNSSIASLKLGHRLRAIKLAFQGVMTDRSSRYLSRQLARSLTPEALLRALKPFRSRPSAG